MSKFVMIFWLGAVPDMSPSLQVTFTQQNLSILGYETRAQCEADIPVMRRLNPTYFIFECKEVR